MPRRRKRAQVVEIAGERSDELFRILVSEGREMSFLPIPEELEGTTDINDLFAQPTSDDLRMFPFSKRCDWSLASICGLFRTATTSPLHIISEKRAIDARASRVGKQAELSHPHRSKKVT
jgi:hypothetical protein